MTIGTVIAQDNDLNFVALVGGTQSEVKGRKTMPSQRIFDPDFQYQPSCKTNIRETWERARRTSLDLGE
jgi:hypothetical protein